MQLFPHRQHLDDELKLLGPPHPGEIIREDLLPRCGLSIAELAQHLGVARSTLSGVINERTNIGPKLANRLSQAFGTDPLYWLVLQAHHESWKLQKVAKQTTGVMRLTLTQRGAATSLVRAPSATSPRARVRRPGYGRAASKSS